MNIFLGFHQLFWENRGFCAGYHHIKLSRGDSCPPFRSTGWPELLGCGARAWQRGRGPSLLDIVINQWVSGVSVGVESSNILGFNFMKLQGVMKKIQGFNDGPNFE